MQTKKNRLIARLDIKGENLIKGIHLEGLRVIGSPNEYAKKYMDDNGLRLTCDIISISCWKNKS